MTQKIFLIETPKEYWRHEDGDCVVAVYQKDGQAATYPEVLWALANAAFTLLETARSDEEE